MSSITPQYTLYTDVSAPNGLRVIITLKALGITYEAKYLNLHKGETKLPSYVAINPNGRVPALVDNKTGFTLWESEAIVSYLVEKHDPEHKISAATLEDKFKQLQWLFFQASGQGPYYGQVVFFNLYHPEKVPSVVERFEKETERVIFVLDSVLSKQPFLNGEKVTVADLGFITWNQLAYSFFMPEKYELKTKYPAVWAWHQRLLELPYVKATYEENEALKAANEEAEKH